MSTPPPPQSEERGHIPPRMYNPHAQSAFGTFADEGRGKLITQAKFNFKADGRESTKRHTAFDNLRHEFVNYCKAIPNGGKELAAFIAEDQGINVESIVEPDHFKVGKWARPESSPARPSREVSVEPFSATLNTASSEAHQHGVKSYWDLPEPAREIDERLFLPLQRCLPADVQRSINIGSSPSCARLIAALQRLISPEQFTTKAAMLTELLNTKFEGNTAKTKADLLDMVRQMQQVKTSIKDIIGFVVFNMFDDVPGADALRVSLSKTLSVFCAPNNTESIGSMLDEVFSLIDTLGFDKKRPNTRNRGVRGDDFKTADSETDEGSETDTEPTEEYFTKAQLLSAVESATKHALEHAYMYKAKDAASNAPKQANDAATAKVSTVQIMGSGTQQLQQLQQKWGDIF